MAEWQVVARGTNIWDLKATVADLSLPKGSRVQVAMDLKFPVGWAFDAAGAELIFKPFVPNGMTLTDVYGEGSTGIVELEADPAWLLATLLFIKTYWLAIIIAGLVLTTIIALITVLVKIAVAPALPIAQIAVTGGIILLGLVLLKAAAGEEGRRKKRPT